ncbi:hypothetical protein BD311DRAFT_150822 [Dichomitus squalens]|uniref:Uncharacterized protein n=1 Tax=Dichomitus squalens TaxID=114155 RepID=A0A4V2K127_9APHY|nr:hypothetical protein BD311DRAFT_150822 [Dichomitus squalens]
MAGYSWARLREASVSPRPASILIEVYSRKRVHIRLLPCSHAVERVRTRGGGGGVPLSLLTASVVCSTTYLGYSVTGSDYVI